MDWVSILVNLGSGSIGVVVTLALTGFWNWRHRRQTRLTLEKNAIVTYAKAAQEEVNWLWKHNSLISLANFDKEPDTQLNHISEFLDKIHHLIILNLELNTVVADKEVGSSLAECTKELTKFTRLFDFNAVWEMKENEPAEKFKQEVDKVDAALKAQLFVIYEVYTKNIAHLLISATTRK